MPKIPETDDFVVDLKNKPKTKPSNKLNKETLLSRWQDGQENKTNFINFVKYNNGFLAMLVIGVIAFSSLAMASDDVRDATIGGKQVYAEGVDNTLLLELDLDNFNMDFTITGIIENDEEYLVTYSYVDFDIIDGAWQYIEKTGGRRISKPFRKDLGLYLAGQLGQEATSRVKALKKLQKQEQTKGQTQIVQVTEYSGLIGKVLNLSSAVFAGYEPVKKVKLKTPKADERALGRMLSGGDNLAEVYNEWVEDNSDLVQNLDGDIVDESLANQDEFVTNEHGLETNFHELEIGVEGEVAGETIINDENVLVEDTDSSTEENIESIPTDEESATESTEEIATEPVSESAPETTSESEVETTPEPAPTIESTPEPVAELVE